MYTGSTLMFACTWLVKCPLKNVLYYRSIHCPPQQPAAPATAATGPAAASSSAPAVDARALAAALGNISSGQMQMQRAPGPTLADVLTPEVIIPLLRQRGVLERLAPHLPVGSQSVCLSSSAASCILYPLILSGALHMLVQYVDGRCCGAGGAQE